MADEEKKVTFTKPGSHVATERGYADGVIIEPNEPVPSGIPVSENWMEPVDKNESKLARAIDEALDPLPDDVDLTQLQPAALEALAAQKGINPKGLSKKDLITAIKAAHDPKR